MKTALPYLFAATLLFASGDGAAAPWARHTVDAADGEAHRTGADGVRLGDLDGDGDPDVATGWEEGEMVRVYLNPGPETAKDPWPAVTVGGVEDAEDAVFADLDDDGRLDVVSATEGATRTVFVHWAPAAPTPVTDDSGWKTAPIPATEKRQWWMYTLPLDADDDGDTDLLVGSKNAGASLTWLENPGAETARDLSAWKAHRLCDVGWIMSLRHFEAEAGSFVLFSDRKGDHPGVYLLPRLAEAPWFGEPILIGGAGEEIMFLDIARLDDDERLDVVAAIRPDTIRVFYQPDDPAGPWPDTADLDPLPGDRFGTGKAVRVGRLDDDEIPDFAITCENAHRGKSGVLVSSIHSEFRTIGGPDGIKFDRIELLDLDGDGDLDLLTCEERAGLGVVWYENPAR